MKNVLSPGVRSQDRRCAKLTIIAQNRRAFLVAHLTLVIRAVRKRGYRTQVFSNSFTERKGNAVVDSAAYKQRIVGCVGSLRGIFWTEWLWRSRVAHNHANDRDGTRHCDRRQCKNHRREPGSWRLADVRPDL